MGSSIQPRKLGRQYPHRFPAWNPRLPFFLLCRQSFASISVDIHTPGTSCLRLEAPPLFFPSRSVPPHPELAGPVVSPFADVHLLFVCPRYLGETAQRGGIQPGFSSISWTMVPWATPPMITRRAASGSTPSPQTISIEKQTVLRGSCNRSAGFGPDCLRFGSVPPILAPTPLSRNNKNSFPRSSPKH